MSQQQHIIASIVSQKILPLFTHSDIIVAKKAVKICYDAGLKCFEFTNRTPNAPEIFYELKKYCTAELKGMLLGVGTIRNTAEAGQFPTADFMVSPFITQQLIDYTASKKITWIPGCSTASEIAMAADAGIDMVKIFPANFIGGAAFIKMMKEIFPSIKMIATGGMKAGKEELGNWFDNGTDAVGIGGQLFGKDFSDMQQAAAVIQKLL
ncbi:MAG: bifunctional 4-hydroxy-2-oxoglutarate aldolase/2-dehydro-3-deoxy-phosphogluconate aldolase [Ferruginibacter sp.]